MRHSGAYGDRFAERFRLERASSFVTRALQKSELAVTEIRCDGQPEHRMTEPIPREEAYLIALQLRDYPAHAYWEDGKQAPMSSLRAGDTVLYDLRRDPRVLLDKPFHSVHFYVPRTALDTIATEAGAPRIDRLEYEPGVGVVDETMRHLGMSMQAALERPEHASRVFIDHLILAVSAHVAQTYGGLTLPSRPRVGGLAPWQERRAKELLRGNLDGNFALRDLARECGLSTGHFARAFRQSTGMPPHAWLLRQRVETAQSLMCEGRLSLADIASATGFASQSHFTRTFTRLVGNSPRAWLRSVAG